MRTPVQRSHDQVRMWGADTHDGQSGGAFDCLEISEQRGLGTAPMFQIEQKPVEAALSREFRDYR